jgi:hypothetical protein
MNKFIQHINVAYPSGNKPIFEEWFAENYIDCSTDRKLIPFFPTSYFVNNGYNEDAAANKEAQDYIDSLDRSQKWFIVAQYDNGCFVDFKDLDVLQFNMSKPYDVPLPLLCQPHPYKFSGSKKWFANFVGSRTHSIRDEIKKLEYKEGYYLSLKQHSIEDYCRILYDSIFTLCFRGYGSNSFRIAEAVQYGSIPVYISDEFILPKWMDFEKFGVIINAGDAGRIDQILSDIDPYYVVKKQEQLAIAYEKYYTYEANLKYIIKYLEAEYHKRQK